MALSINQIKEEIRNDIGGSVVFIEDQTAPPQLIDDLVGRYFGRGKLSIVSSDDLKILANFKSAMYDEYIVEVSFLSVTEEGEVDYSELHVKKYAVTAEVTVNADGESVVKYSLTPLDGNLRAGKAELRTKEILDAQNAAQATQDKKKLILPK